MSGKEGMSGKARAVKLLMMEENDEEEEREEEVIKKLAGKRKKRSSDSFSSSSCSSSSSTSNSEDDDEEEEEDNDNDNDKKQLENGNEKKKKKKKKENKEDKKVEKQQQQQQQPENENEPARKRGRRNSTEKKQRAVTRISPREVHEKALVSSYMKEEADEKAMTKAKEMIEKLREEVEISAEENEKIELAKLNIETACLMHMKRIQENEIRKFNNLRATLELVTKKVRSLPKEKRIRIVADVRSALGILPPAMTSNCNNASSSSSSAANGYVENEKEKGIASLLHLNELDDEDDED